MSCTQLGINVSSSLIEIDVNPYIVAESGAGE